MENSKNICSLHNSAYVSFCLQLNCTRKIVCSKCIPEHVINCGNNFLYFEDISTENLSKIFKADLFRKVMTPTEAEHFVSLSAGTSSQNISNTIVTNFFDAIRLSIGKLTHQLEVEHLLEDTKNRNLKEVKNLLCLETLKNIVANGSESEEQLKNVSLFSRQTEILSSLGMMKTSFSKALQGNKKNEILKKRLDKIKALIEEELSKEFEEKQEKLQEYKEEKQDDYLKFDRDSILPFVTLSNNNRILSTNEFRPILIDMIMKPNSGRYVINTTIRTKKKFSATEVCDDTRFIQFGICDPNSNVREKNSYKKEFVEAKWRGTERLMFSASLDLDLAKRSEKSQYYYVYESNKITFDSAIGELTLISKFANGKQVQTTEAIAGKSYIPYIIIYRHDVEIQLN